MNDKCLYTKETVKRILYNLSRQGLYDPEIYASQTYFSPLADV